MRRWGLVVIGAALLSSAPGAGAMNKLDFRLQNASGPALLERLRDASLLAQLPEDGSEPAQDVFAAALSDYTRLVEALYAQGYYSASVRILIDGREAALIEPLSVPDRIGRVDVVIDPGRPFRFGQVSVAPLAPGDAPVSEFNRGAPALATVVRDAAQGAVTGWREAGHAKAAISGQSITARHGDARLDVAVDVSPGPRVSFGDVVVTGETDVKPGRVRQIAGIPRGAVFAPGEVEDAAERLRRTGTFRSVDLTEGEAVGADGSMDIRIDVVDRKPRRFGAGIELSSLEGLTLSGFWLHRNFFGGAERFRFDAEISQLGGTESGPDYSLNTRLEKPAVYGAETLAYAEAGLSYSDEPDFIEEKANLGIGVSRTFSDRLQGELGIALSYSRVTDRYLPKLPNGEYPTRELTVFSIPFALTYDARDNQVNPTEGYYLRTELEPFTEFDSGENGARLYFDARTYRAFGEDDGLVLAGRAQLGALFGPSAQDAPPDYLFYSGGGGTVRGQPFESLDVDYGGTRLGGRSFAGLSGEARVKLSDTFGVVAFADAGYVGPESLVDGSGDWHAGAGLGLRYNTVVGPIRLDVAGPVAGETGDGVQFYLGIGQAF
ncbi:autotransporter assembly complex protein TamA [Pseudoponticoccus marisrubri]|uniref:Bacterial surface antigen (D15) domain-containing protein n=1 Tax=Pseudoponticoccus marisrubri TaxID=1685382 RepID=A0A0W7WK84_9RHOB|nr:BamA/TamA family outer membrane protein [Pseudoponticoccus marisrubri]KUF10987.1 hypothetical protein AVJ23_07970 [Pseudoponticoccus marisrubri]